MQPSVASSLAPYVRFTFGKLPLHPLTLKLPYFAAYQPIWNVSTVFDAVLIHTAA